MMSLICLLLVAQGAAATSNFRWDYTDVLIEDSLGPYVAFAADYNYTTGDIYVAAGVDSGYFGDGLRHCLIFRSQDHGLTWDISSNFQLINGWDVKNVDLVVTKNDTLYLTLHRCSTSGAGESIAYFKIYGGSITPLDVVSTTTDKFLSPVLVRDDFEPFYLYRAYIIDCDINFDTVRFERSPDKGTNWTNVYNSASNIYNDCDLTVSDSTLYCTYLYYTSGSRSIRTRIYRDRGASNYNIENIQATSDTINADIKYPRIGATTTLPDSGQLVYTFYSQKNSGSENWDLLYRYSEDGGSNWSSTPDTLVKGGLSPVLCDLRGYQVAPNQWMDMAYCFTSSSPTLSFENFWCWSSEDDPTNWQGTTSVATGANRSTPELIYSPPAGGGAVVFNDSLGNLWFDAPWIESGIAEDTDKKDKIRSQIVLPGSLVKLNPKGAVVYDVTGREITKLNGDTWDLKSGKDGEIKAGIYFIFNGKTGEKIKLSVIK